MPLRGLAVLPRILLGVVLALLLAACDGGAAQTPEMAGSAGTPTLQPDDLVDLTVYYRSGSGAGAYLEPVTREVPVGDDLPRKAVELLLAGPQEGDGRDLQAPLPTSTRLRDLRVEGEVATVDLSAHVVDDAADVGASAENEVLALAALAGTLTEFPAIDQVRLLVEGQEDGWVQGVNVGGFWGSWGKPEVLVRDDSVIGPPREGDGVPALTDFLTTRQEVGASDGGPVTVASIRTRDRTTYVRVVVELENPADPDSAAAVPPVRAVPNGDVLDVQLRDVAGLGPEVTAGQRLDITTPGFGDVLLDGGADGPSVTVTVGAEQVRPFRLHTLTSPTRVVLDVQK